MRERGGGARGSGAAPEPRSAAELTGGSLLARNAALNLAGWIAPMAVALLAVPFLIHGMGTERFGVLTVGWVVIGYFGLFDFGLGRAVTKLVAERLGTEREGEVPGLVWTTLLLLLVLGVAGMALLLVAAPRLVADVLKVSPGLREETRRSFEVLALSLPWVVSSSGLLGALEASQRFGLVNAVRVPSILFNYLAPLAVLPFSTSLVPVVAVLVVGRVLSWLAYLVACLRAYPALRARLRPEWNRAGSLVRFGGWMTVSNTVSPLMTHLDRFLIGALISMAAVAYYASAYELVTRLWLIPNALMGVFFPAFAASFVVDPARTRLLFERAVRVIFVGIFPIVLLLVVWAPEGLGIWLGPEFARESTWVLRWLALGVFVNCLAQVPFALIQGLGRPDLTAKLHLLELPMYALAIWLLSRRFGLEGVAVAWVLRVMVDTVALFAIASRFLAARSVLPHALAMIGVGAAVFGLASVQDGIALKALYTAVVLGGFAFHAWTRLLDPAERSFARSRLLPWWRGARDSPSSV